MIAKYNTFIKLIKYFYKKNKKVFNKYKDKEQKKFYILQNKNHNPLKY
jgi:hypothetical protein